MVRKIVSVWLLLLSIVVLLNGCGDQNESLVISDGSAISMAPAAAQYMISPISGSFRVTTEFGEPINVPGVSDKTHPGLDLAPISASAWNVRAPASGVVEAAGYGTLEGNYIVIRHSNVWNGYRYRLVATVYTKYYHLANIASGIEETSHLCTIS